MHKDGPQTKRKILDAGVRLIRRQGFAAAKVDAVCAAAGVTKGAFFHHFASKEDLALGCAAHFAAFADDVFAQAAYQSIADPLERLLGYVDFRASLMKGPLTDFTCLLGMLAQETYDAVPPVRDAVGQHLEAHARMLAVDIELARQRYAPRAAWSAASLARYILANIQGAFVLAKAYNDPLAASDSLSHLRRYLETQFDRHTPLSPKGD